MSDIQDPMPEVVAGNKTYTLMHDEPANKLIKRSNMTMRMEVHGNLPFEIKYSESNIAFVPKDSDGAGDDSAPGDKTPSGPTETEELEMQFCNDSGTKYKAIFLIKKGSLTTV